MSIKFNQLAKLITITSLLASVLVVGCARRGEHQDKMFTYKDKPVVSARVEKIQSHRNFTSEQGVVTYTKKSKQVEEKSTNLKNNQQLMPPHQSSPTTESQLHQPVEHKQPKEHRLSNHVPASEDDNLKYDDGDYSKDMQDKYPSDE